MARPTHDEQLGKAKSDRIVPARPKSFSPQMLDASEPNAWAQLEALSDGGRRSEVLADELIAVARSTLKLRELRYRHLPKSLFGEPGWDMLLSLYVASRSEARQTVSNLCASSGAPATTALRWIDYLEREEFVRRRNNPLDLRVVFIELRTKGSDAVEAFLADVLQSGAKRTMRS